MASPKHRGGWPKRDRVSLIVRVDRELSDLLSAAASERGVTRNLLIADWLAALAEASVLGGGEGFGELLVRLRDLVTVLLRESAAQSDRDKRMRDAMDACNALDVIDRLASFSPTAGRSFVRAAVGAVRVSKRKGAR